MRTEDVPGMLVIHYPVPPFSRADEMGREIAS